MEPKKKMGNANRTKNQIRGSKSRGNQFEYSVRNSLKQVFADILLCKEEGYVKQYDLVSHDRKVVIECKSHKSVSWNEARKWFKKLKTVSPKGYVPCLVFKSNRQPVLVMNEGKASQGGHPILTLTEFDALFGVPFTVHSRRKVRE